MSNIENIRLTVGDQRRVREALGEYFDMLDDQGSDGELTSDERTVAGRLARHAIGCSAYDLRDGENAWIDYVVECEAEGLDALSVDAWEIADRPSGPLG